MYLKGKLENIKRSILLLKVVIPVLSAAFASQTVFAATVLNTVIDGSQQTTGSIYSKSYDDNYDAESKTYTYIAEDMQDYFINGDLETCDISGIDFSSITSSRSLFMGDKKLTTLHINDTFPTGISAITDNNAKGYEFALCESLNKIVLYGEWSVDKLTNLKTILTESGIEVEQITSIEKGSYESGISNEDVETLFPSSNPSTFYTYVALDKEVTYTGAPFSLDPVTVVSSGETADIRYGTTEGVYNLSTPPSYINAGEYVTFFRIEADGTDTIYDSYKLTINKANSSISATDQSTVYPSKKTFNITVSGNGVLSVESADENVFTASVTGNTVTVTPVNIGTADLTIRMAESQNYKVCSKTISVHVNSGNIVSTVENSSVMYNGELHSPNFVTVTEPQSGFTVKYGTEEGVYDLDLPKTYSEAGIYHVYYKITAPNYEDKTGNYILTIARKPINVPSQTERCVYNGKPQTGVKSGTGYSITGNTATDADNYTAVASVSANYIWSSNDIIDKNIDWSIEKADPVITAPAQSTTYPNTLDLAFSSTGDGAITGSLNDDIAYATNRNGVITVTPRKAGTTTLTLSQEESRNYNSAEKTVSITVQRAKSSVSAGDVTLTYPEKKSVPFTVSGNGVVTAVSNDTSIATALVKEGYIEVTAVNSGETDIVITHNASDQYDTSSCTIHVTIEKGTFHVTATAYPDLVYTGEGQELGKISVTEDIPYTVSYLKDGRYVSEAPTFANAGPHTASYKVSSPGYNDVTGEISNNIARADSELTGTSPVEIPYDGLDHSFVYGSKGAGDIAVTLSGNRIATVTPVVIEGNENVNGGAITIKNITGTGTVYVTLSMAETGNWNAVEKTFTVNIIEKQINLTFDTNNGAPVKKTTTVYGAEFTLPETERTGYTFTGWEVNGELVTTDMTDTLDVPSEDTTYKARWEANEYTITFDSNGGTGYVPIQERAYDDGKALSSASGLKKSGCIFASWNTEQDGTGRTFADQSVKNVSEKDDVTLYATWVENKIPEEANTYDEKKVYHVGDIIVLDGTTYICIKDTDQGTFEECWRRLGDEDGDHTVPVGSSVISVSENGIRKTIFNKGDYIYVENEDGTYSIYICLEDNTDGEEGLTSNWKLVYQSSPVKNEVYNINVIYNIGDLIYKDGRLLKCNTDGTTGPYDESHWDIVAIFVKKIAISSNKLDIGIGDDLPLTVLFTPEDASDKSITWTSFDPEIASVDENGTVRGLAKGTATIQALSTSGESDAIDINVYQPLEGIGLSPENVELKEGDEYTLTINFVPEDARHGEVTWESSDADTVSVDNGIIKALKRGGQAEITASCDGYSKKCSVTVLDPCTISIAPKEVTLYINGSNEQKLTAVVEPADAGDVVWTSSDEGVATVDETGLVKAISAGTATITADCLGITDTCSVTVIENSTYKLSFDNDYAEGLVKDRLTLGIHFIPEDKHGSVNWKTSDPSIVRIVSADDSSVTVEILRMGFVEITAEDISGVSGSCTVRGLKLYDFGTDGSLVETSGGYSVKKSGSSYYCFDEKGRAVAGFVAINGNSYYFDHDTGKALIGLQEINGGLYFFNKNGVMAVNSKVKVKGTTYHFGEDGRAVGGIYYLPDKSGSAWFAFDDEGIMQSGVFAADLSDTSCDASAVSADAKLYCFKNGKLYIPKKNGFFTLNGYRYYIYTDGHAEADEIELEDKKGKTLYRFDPETGRLYVGAVLVDGELVPADKNGQAVTPKKPGLTKVGCDFFWYNDDNTVYTGWKDVPDNKGGIKGTYYFDPDTGASSSGIREIDGVTYVFVKGACIRKDSVVTVNKKKYAVKVDETGHDGCAVVQTGWVNINRKLYFAKDNGVVRTGLFTLSGNTLSENTTHFANTAGAVQTDKWVTVNKVKYYADTAGSFATGRQSIKGKTYYLDPGSSPAGAMMKGLVTEPDGNTYLYANNGVLQTGNKFVTFNKRKYFVDQNGKVCGIEEGHIQAPGPKGASVTYELDADGALLNGTKDMDGKLYLYKNGLQVLASAKPAKGGDGVWKTVNGRKYLLYYTDDTLSANTARTGRYTDAKGASYMLRENGDLASNSLAEVPADEVTEDMTPGEDGRYYFFYDKKGRLVTRSMIKDGSGWYKVGKNFAYIYESGTAASGWATISGKTYWFDPDSGLTKSSIDTVNNLPGTVNS